MNSTRLLVIGVSAILGGQLAFAPDVSRYRAYALDSSLDVVVAASGARATDARTLHERPATIQELEWRAPSVASRNMLADPVREISVTFYNDALCQVIVHRDRDGTDALTHSDYCRVHFDGVWRAHTRVGENPDEPTSRGLSG